MKSHNQFKKTLIVAVTIFIVVLFVMPALAVLISMLKVTQIKTDRLTDDVKTEASIGFNLENAKSLDNGMYEIPEYQLKREFSITSKDGLNRFQIMVNTGKHDFKDKIVYLEKDIDYEDGILSIGYYYYGQNRVFKGDFYGCGHTISNFVIGYSEADEPYRRYQYVYNSSYYSGFFTYAEGSIHGLRLRDGHYWGNKWYVGCLVGFAKETVKIEECVIENFHLEKSSSAAMCGIVGAFHSVKIPYGTGDSPYVRNCYVESDNLTLGIGPYAHMEEGNSGVSRKLLIENNIINSNTRQIRGDGQNAASSNNITDISSADLSGFDYSSIGGDDNSSIWYWGAYDYNGNWPYLRRFILWGRIYFGVGSRNYFDTVYVEDSDDNIIEIPREWLDNAQDKTGNVIYICNRKIEAIPKSGVNPTNPTWVFFRNVMIDPVTDTYIPSYTIFARTSASERSFSFALDLNLLQSCSMVCLVPGCTCCAYYISKTYKIYDSTDIQTTVDLCSIESMPVTLKQGTDVFKFNAKCFTKATFRFNERDGTEHIVQITLNDNIYGSVLILAINYEINCGSGDKCLGVTGGGKSVNGRWSGSVFGSTAERRLTFYSIMKSYQITIE